MKDFNWKEFKNGTVAVHCDTEEKANIFLEECNKQQIKWCNGRSIVEEDNSFERYECDTCYSYKPYGLEFCQKEYYKNNGYKIIKWEPSKMEEKKVYKIQDLFKDEFIGKKVKTNSENGEFIFTITKYDNIFDLVVRNNDEYSINDLFFISEMLKLEFELLESEDNKMKEKEVTIERRN